MCRKRMDRQAAVVIYIHFDMILMKPLYWLGDSLDQVREFAPEARARIGFELYRVLYVAKFAHAIYVLHAFIKKTRQTPKREMDVATTRYRDLAQAMKRLY